MVTFVPAHIDQFLSLRYRPKCGLSNLTGRARERHYGAIGRIARIDIEQFDAIDPLDLVGDLLDHAQIAAFAKIGNAFYELLHKGWEIVTYYSHLQRKSPPFASMAGRG